MEISLTTLMTPYVPFAIGIVVALMFRVALLLSEAVWVALVLLFFKTP